MNENCNEEVDKRKIELWAFLGVELILLINLKNEIDPIGGGATGILQVIEGVVLPVGGKRGNVKWKEKLQNERQYFTQITIKSVKTHGYQS